MPLALIRSSIVKTNKVQYERPLWLEWTNSPSPGVIGYNVFQGTNTGIYETEYFTSNNLLDVTNLLRGMEYFFAATAVNSNGIQSVKCPETSFSGRVNTLWMFVILNDEPIYSQIPVGIEFLRTNSVDTMESPDFINWYYLCPAGQILFSNVVTFTP
jgi:hypothetical protein